MIRLQRTDSLHPEFIRLVRDLDELLAVLDGEEHDFYHQFNFISDIRYAVVAYEESRAVACGAIKEFSPGVMEVKRMYTMADHRRKGLASQVLQELEKWALELGAHTLLLETGIRQPDAIALYGKHGFQRLPNYGQYAGVESSVCFAKKIE